MHDLVGPDLPLTQDFHSDDGRSTNECDRVAIEMQKAGLISYVRGRMHIADIEAVRHRSCECEEDVREHHRIIFGARTNSTSFGTMPPVPGL
jgi:hypothetical protein